MNQTEAMEIAKVKLDEWNESRKSRVEEHIKVCPTCSQNAFGYCDVGLKILLELPERDILK